MIPQLPLSAWNMAYPAFFYSVGFFMYMPAHQEQVVHLICSEMHAIKCHSHPVEAEASTWVKNFLIISCVTSLLTAGTIGGLSDKYGRKPFLGFTFVTYGIQAVASWAVGYFATVQPHWRWVLSIAYCLQGLSGGFSITLMCQFAYCADTTTLAERPRVFVVLESMVGLGGVIGTLCGGLISDHVSHIAPFGFVSAFCFLCAFFLIFIPESLPEQARNASPLRLREQNTLASMYVLTQPPTRYTSQPRLLSWMSLAFFLSFMVVIGLRVVLVLFTQLVFDWSDSTIGYFLSVQNGCRGLSAFALLPIIERVTSSREGQLKTIQLFLILSAISTALFAVGQYQGLAFAISALVGICMAIPFGYMRATMSKAVAANEQGHLLSGLSSLEIVCGVISPEIFSSLFRATEDTYPSANFLLMSALFVISTAVLGFIATPRPLLEQSEQKQLLLNDPISDSPKTLL